MDRQEKTELFDMLVGMQALSYDRRFWMWNRHHRNYCLLRKAYGDIVREENIKLDELGWPPV